MWHAPSTTVRPIELDGPESWGDLHCLALRDPQERTYEALSQTPRSPEPAPRMISHTTQDRVLSITACFESRSTYRTVTGNGDGMLFRAGLMRWSIGMATLQPLLREMLRRSPDLFVEHLGPARGRQLESLATGKAHWRDAAIDLTGAPLSARARELLPDWHSGLEELMGSPLGIAVQRDALAPLLDEALAWCGEFGVETERGLALFYDFRVQHGVMEPHCKSRILERLREGMTDRQRLLIVTEECVESMGGRRRGAVLRRNLCIINGEGDVDGRTYDLAREFGLSDSAMRSS